MAKEQRAYVETDDEREIRDALRRGLQRLLASGDVTRETIAKDVGISRAYLSQILGKGDRQRRPLTLQFVLRFGKRMGVSVAQIFESIAPSCGSDPSSHSVGLRSTPDVRPHEATRTSRTRSTSYASIDEVGYRRAIEGLARIEAVAKACEKLRDDLSKGFGKAIQSMAARAATGRPSRKKPPRGGSGSHGGRKFA